MQQNLHGYRLEALGLDIGGANLKAAHRDGTARTVPFALWKDPERLLPELTRLCASMPDHTRLAVTMTGELCDCFETKRAGILAILQSVRHLPARLPVRVWTTHGRFLEIHEAVEDPYSVAAANWLALATYIAQRFANENVLLTDTGSTTTDIVYLRRGHPAPRALTDPGRLRSGELVYTGVRRTPICSVLGMDVAAEFFATMLDAYLVDGSWAENAHDRDTADGRPATIAHARARLARMRCADMETFSAEEAYELAQRALRMQWQIVGRAIARVLANRAMPDRVVLAGSGAILGQRVLATHPEWASWPVTRLSDLLGPALSEAACAYAVAMLAAEEP